MSEVIIAPCGVICNLCLGFQRAKNKCVGCSEIGLKPNHCKVCSIKLCAEKNGDENLLCYECSKFPCRRIKDLDKRYITKYAESPIRNLQLIKEKGLEDFINSEIEQWICSKCGQLLCVHRADCIHCGSKNPYFPEK